MILKRRLYNRHLSLFVDSLFIFQLLSYIQISLFIYILKYEIFQEIRGDYQFIDYKTRSKITKIQPDQILEKP